MASSDRNTRNCCVPQCNSRGDSGLSFHLFPKDPNLRKKWEAALKMGKPSSASMRVCSAHFQTSDYFPGVDQSKFRRLKQSTIPSQNLPKRTCDREETESHRKEREARGERRKQRANNKNVFPQKEGYKKQDEIQNANVEPEQCTDNTVPTDYLQHEFVPDNDVSSLRPSLLSFRDVSTQTDSKILEQRVRISKPATLLEILNDTDKLKNFTGLHSFELLDALAACLSDLEDCRVKRQKDMCLRSRTVLTFVKIKQNLSFTSLAILFGISRQTCVNYFKDLVPKLSTVLVNMIPWPDQESIRGNMPIAFMNYRNTRVILDCAETPIEKSKCLRCRILTYSNYKGRHTAKFDVWIAPSGMITNISLCYGGRASDKFIVNDRGILNKLDFQDAVMVDKGYRIERECLERNLILHRPPFVIQKKQMSRQEALRCAEIARARVHVERVIQRMREFGFISETVPWELIPFLDDILVVIAGIVNLSSPVMNIDKFM